MNDLEPQSHSEMSEDDLAIEEHHKYGDTWKHPEGKYDWPKPVALTWGGWRKWRAANRIGA